MRPLYNRVFHGDSNTDTTASMDVSQKHAAYQRSTSGTSAGTKLSTLAPNWPSRNAEMGSKGSDVGSFTRLKEVEEGESR